MLSDVFWNLHDLAVVGHYELRIKEQDIGKITIEAWREESIGGNWTLFDSVIVKDEDILAAITELWQKVCG